MAHYISITSKTGLVGRYSFVYNGSWALKMAANAVDGSGSSCRIRDTVTRLMVLFSLTFYLDSVAQYQSGGKDAYLWLHSYCSTGDEKKW